MNDGSINACTGIPITDSFFDARKIMISGQVFRMYENSPGCFDIYSKERFVRLIETEEYSKADGSAAYVLCCSDSEYRDYWYHYFDLDRNYGETVNKVLADSGQNDFIRKACLYGAGIRVLNQDLWETMVSFIISQQKQIPSIRKCIERLCERFGEYKGWYAFPTAEAIAAAGPEGLKGLGLGYRERYIYETAVKFLADRPEKEELLKRGYKAAGEYLMSYTGIGRKVANCILLFGLGFKDAFPIDTHIMDILHREFYKGELSRERLTLKEYERLAETGFGCFSPCRGIVQQWVFAYELIRSGRAPEGDKD